MASHHDVGAATTSSRTKVTQDGHIHHWEVENSVLDFSEVARLQSEWFTVKEIPCCKWHLSFNLVNRNDLYLGLTQMIQANSIRHSYTIALELFVSDQNNVTLKSATKCYRWGIDKVGLGSVGHTFVNGQRLLAKGDRKVKPKHLLVGCEIRILQPTNEIVDKIQDLPAVTTENEFKLDIRYFEKLLSSGRFSDVAITVDGKSFKVHKAFLAQSSVFSAMFQHDLKEQNTGEIVLTDFRAEVIREMLKFIYTGRTAKVAEWADELLAAADKYDLQDLKRQCEKELCSSLLKENAAHRFHLAEQHSAELLKEKALRFMYDHVAEVFKKGLSASNANAAVKAFEAL